MGMMGQLPMISDIPSFAALRERMRFLQTRQKLLAQNVANADTPGFKPKDITHVGVDPATRGADASRRLNQGGRSGGAEMVMTNPQHLGPRGGSSHGGEARGASYETRPSGNAVNLEDEMLKVAQNQIDFQTAANIYQRGLSTLKIALGRRA
jgi:flagellar basal-body rod protein FlgB